MDTTATTHPADPALCFCGRNHCGRSAAEGCVTTNYRKKIARSRARKAVK